MNNMELITKQKCLGLFITYILPDIDKLSLCDILSNSNPEPKEHLHGVQWPFSEWKEDILYLFLL